MELWVQYGVGVASWVLVILFLVQAAVFIGLYLLFRRTLKMVQELRGKYEPQIDKMMVTVNDLQTTVTHVTETVNTVSTEVRAVSAAVTTSAERISVIATDSAEEIRALVTTASTEIKSMVKNTSTEVQTMVTEVQTTVRATSGDVRTLVTTTGDEVRDFMRNTRDSAETMVERLDLMVERTAGRVEETGDYVQHQVLEPVREVSAIVVGIKVALETLLGYPERKQINQAYSEEELFI